MNIRDIAKLAGVSVATVSKIINRKDADISEKTREKVLAIIQENQYSPYSNIKIHVPSKNIGVLLPSLASGAFPMLAQHLERALLQEDFHMIVRSANPEDTLEHAKELAAKNIDGMIAYLSKPLPRDSIAAKVVTIGASVACGAQFQLQYEEAARAAVKHLISYSHTKICLIPGGFEQEAITSGFLAALNETGAPLSKPLIAQAGNGEFAWQTVVDLIEGGVTAVVCGGTEVATQLFHLAFAKNWAIPKDLSVIALDDTGGCRFLCPPCTHFVFDIASLAKEAVGTLLTQMAKNTPQDKVYTFAPTFHHLNSVATPRYFQGDGIVVVGTLNMDTFLQVGHLPENGETIMAQTITAMPGGKGANQAVGVGKLNGNAHIIGRVGNDQNGRELYSTLLRHNVNTDGLFFDQETPTGRAFIAVDANGNDTIVVHGGANNKLDKDQFAKMDDILTRCKYALLQMEISLEMVQYAIAFCKEKGLRVILKPSPATELPEQYYRDIFLYIPNEKEANQLCPHTRDVKKQAAYFLQKGVENVIITLGERGCYFANAEGTKYYQTDMFKTVDSTGASDCFISALTVFLARGKSMDEAIVFANRAAGMSVTKHGVQASMPGFGDLKEFFQDE